MNEHDLHDELARTTAWTDTLPTDPAADLARGRRRLRRRRAGVGLTATLAVAMVATGGSLATAHLRGPADVGPASASSDGDVQMTMRVGPSGQTITCNPAPVTPSNGIPPGGPATNLIAVFAAHADPSGGHLTGRADDDLIAPISGPCGRPGGAWARSDWSEAGGVGWVAVSVVPKAAHEPPNGYGIPHPRADACGLMDDRSKFTKCWVTTTASGEQVRVGTRGKQAYWAGYVRPDGQLAIATVEGDGRRADPGIFGGAEPTTQTPVDQPSVTLAQLIATVTDPTLDTAS
jgi:hypothetical protein